MISDLVAYIKDLFPVGIIGPVTIGDLPETIDTATSIFLFDGSPSTLYFGASESLERPLIRVNCRSTEYLDGLGNCNLIKTKLDKYYDSGIKGIYLVGDINYLGKDVKRRYEFIMTYRILI